MIDGTPCTVWAAFIRGLIRYLDGVFIGIIAFLNMKPPLQQRLGDKIAKTVVVNSNQVDVNSRRSVWILWLIQIAYFFIAVVGFLIKYALLTFFQNA